MSATSASILVKDVMAARLEASGFNDQDSGHGDSLDTNRATLLVKPVAHARTRSPFVSTSALEAITDDSAFPLQPLQVSNYSSLHAEQGRLLTWNSDASSQPHHETKKLPTATESCSTFI
ncbi:hypothetical protein TSMEX_007521 [Taenia solium]|eukprot:TsM_001148900 transcript=TsM_001148900 gene=TsM_001148900